LFVGNPDKDYEAIYGDAYYQGNGADRLVDYAHEISKPDSTIRRYEWEGITSWAKSSLKNLSTARWLDYGCGNGGLVSYASALGFDVCGYDESPVSLGAKNRGVRVLDRNEYENTGPVFDIVTAIEVIEHTEDPVAVLRSIRSKMREGALLLYTTSNSLFRPRRLSSWSYAVPEIHISYFQPKTMEVALSRAGFASQYMPLPNGFDSIIRFKILKSMKLKKRSLVERILPWRAISFLANFRYGVFDFPVGVNSVLTGANDKPALDADFC